MNLTVLTANLPRHLALLRALHADGHSLQVVMEPKSLEYRGDSGTLRRYLARVRAAETLVFGVPFMPGRVTVIPRGELTESLIDWAWTDQVVVFSASYIKGALMDHLEALGALNLHVGIAPEYRGSAPNMWAHFDGKDDLVGAQVQRLSRALDAGEILAEARPAPSLDYFVRGMRAVEGGIQALVQLLNTPPPWPQVRANDKAAQIRYATHADFTEDVAAALLLKHLAR